MHDFIILLSVLRKGFFFRCQEKQRYFHGNMRRWRSKTRSAEGANNAEVPERTKWVSLPPIQPPWRCTNALWLLLLLRHSTPRWAYRYTTSGLCNHAIEFVARAASAWLYPSCRLVAQKPLDDSWDLYARGTRVRRPDVSKSGNGIRPVILPLSPNSETKPSSFFHPASQ